MDSLVNDFRHAVRSLAKTPSFSFIVVLILAVGIGANTAVFSLVNAVLIRPPAFVEPDRLVALHEGAPELGFGLGPFSPPDLLDVQRDQRSFEGVGAYSNVPFELSGRGDAERVVGAKVTANLFPLLGVEPVLGRLFAASEDRPGNDFALISWELWQRGYAGSTAVIGESIQLDRRPYTVIGVMPPSFGFPLRGPAVNNQPADVWVPMAFTDPEAAERGSRFNNSVIARLRNGVTLAEAQAELDVLVRRVAEEYPPMLRNNADALQLPARPLREEIAGAVEAPVLMLFAAIGLVLLVACANVANLMLSRAATREREVRIRAALGATGLRLFRRDAVEALLLTLTGGVLGVAIARWLLDAVPGVVARAVPGLEDAPLDLRVLAFSACVSIATGIVFGALPLLTGGQRDLGALREGGARTTPWRQHTVQNGLVVSTVALAFILLIGAGLFLRSFSTLIATDPGFRSAGVLSVSLALPQQGYPTATQVRNFHQMALDRLAGLPGVQSATVATDLPLESYETRMFTPEHTQLELARGAAGSTRLSWVHGPYFETLGLRLVGGRLFLPEEHGENRQVVIVNEALANRLWPDGDAVGQRLKWGPPESPVPWLTIIGVVSDVAGGSAVSATMREDRPIRAYEPFRQFPDFLLDNAVSGFGRDVRLAVRAEGELAGLIAPLRRELASLDPQLAIARIAQMEELVGERVAPQRFTTALLAAFGAGALLLVATGLYGLLSFTVEQRRREIGVRVALGAEPRKLVQMMLGKGLKLVGLGVALGLLASVAVTRLLASFLYQTDAYDPATFAAVSLVLVGVALFASGWPAYRAARLDPMRALREE